MPQLPSIFCQLIVIFTYYMSNPNCRPPICSFNCCNQAGLCPSSTSECWHSNLKNPVWLYVIIGVVVIFIIVGAIIVLTIFKKRRLRRQQKQKQKQQPKEAQLAEEVMIEMKEHEPQPNILINKKNIYVYERQVVDNATIKDTRSGSSSISSKKSASQRSQRSNRSNRTLNSQNPFEKKSRIRKHLL